MDQDPKAPVGSDAAHGPAGTVTAGADHVPKDSVRPTDAGRRRLLRGSAAAAPVLLSLHSGPVAASASMSCTVASSFVSVATFASRNPGATTLQCSTLNAHHWHQSAKAVATLPQAQRPAWATRNLAAYLGQSCGAMSELHPMQPSAYEVWHVMSLGAAPATTGELGVLHHILGLALSIDNGRGVVNTGGRINTVYLAGVWQNYKATGGYRLPAGHLNWTEVELINWLRMLQYPIPLHQA